MLNFFKRKRNKKGFTLVEVLTVMFVVAAIAAVALPSYKRAVEKSRATQGMATLESIAKAQMNHNVLRGSFSPTFNGLPIEIRDNNSALVTGSEFSDDYFNFTLSNTDAIAIATRQNGEYELSVDYITGKIYCSPGTHSVCMRFGLEERGASVGQGGMGTSVTTPEIPDGRVCEGGYCYDYLDGQQVAYCVADSSGKECIKDGTYCDKESQTCKSYQDGKLVRTCRSNAEFSGCLEGEEGDDVRIDPETGNPLDGLICTERKCTYYQNGKEVGTCDAIRGEPSSKCYETFGLNGIACEKDKCITYEKGKAVLVCNKKEGYCENDQGEKCIINELGTGCKKTLDGQDGLVCNEKECIFYDKDGNIIGSCSAENEGQNKECYARFKLSGQFCDKEKCYEFDNGEIKGECSSKNDGENRECYEAFGLSGFICDDEECVTFEKGKAVFSCNKKENTCFDPLTGEYCNANEDFSGCAKEEIKTGFVCNKEGCTYYDENGKELGICEVLSNGDPSPKCYEKFKLTGEVCDGSGKCATYENGQMVAYCNKIDKICFDNVAGKECTPNENWTGCAKKQTGLVCNEEGCIYYDGDGKEVGRCDNPNPYKCYEYLKLTGPVCMGDKECATFENGQMTSWCNISEKRCFDMNGEDCTPNDTYTGCVQKEITTGLVCDKEGCTYYDEHGNKVDSCGIYRNGQASADCYEMFGLTGQACDGVDMCYNFENGKPTLICSVAANECTNKLTGEKCTANADFTGCSYNTGNAPNLENGIACDEKTGICYYFNNGEIVGQCTLGKDCDVIKEGILCNQDYCSVIRDGKELMQCDRNAHICFNKEGEKCIANPTFTACEDGSILGGKIQTGLVCDEERCIYYDDSGNPIKDCGLYNGQPGRACYESFGLSGEACDSKGCYTYKNGEMTSYCSINSKTGAVRCFDRGTGQQCEPNANHTGCKEEGGETGLVCNDSGCIYYDDDGNKIGACANESVCYKEFGLSGEACDNEGNCYTYDKGIWTSYCDKNKQCFYADGEKCEPNDNYSGCLKLKEELKEGWVCDGFSCQYYEGGKPTGESCNSNGAGGCIKGEGEEMVCINGTCNIYQDGNVAYSCKKGSSAAGGCDRKGFVCDREMCYEYIYGTKVSDGCYSNGSGGCIKGEGTEMGYCDGKQCSIYVNGKYAYTCKPKSSLVGGCDLNGFSCKEDSTECYNYAFGNKTEETCYNNGNGGCIEGKGEEMACIGTTCYMYKDGELVNTCAANDLGTGCVGGGVQNGVVCSGDMCRTYENGEVVSSCYSNNDGGCIEGKNEEFVCYGEQCNYYIDGKKQYSCVKGYSGEGGCELNGVSCSGDKCYDYKYGTATDDGCYSNKAGDGCIKGTGTEMGYCSESKVTNCQIYVDGEPLYTCQQGSSTSGGCDRNGRVCDGNKCYEYEYGHADKNSVCYSNNAGDGCINGAGTEMGYCNPKGDCEVYVNGKRQYTCRAGSSTAGGCDLNGFACTGDKCYDFKYGAEINDGCYSNNSGDNCIKGKGTELGFCSDGNDCPVYVNGEPQYNCQWGSSAEGGCQRNGYVCNENEIQCSNYVYGEVTGATCYNDGNGKCISGKDREVVCMGEGVCYIYNNGKPDGTCKPNDAGTGCQEEGGGDDKAYLKCEDNTCTEYIGDKPTGIIYKLDKKGNCTKYDNGKEVGVVDDSFCKG